MKPALKVVSLIGRKWRCSPSLLELSGNVKVQNFAYLRLGGRREVKEPLVNHAIGFGHSKTLCFVRQDLGK